MFLFSGRYINSTLSSFCSAHVAETQFPRFLDFFFSPQDKRQVVAIVWLCHRLFSRLQPWLQNHLESLFKRFLSSQSTHLECKRKIYILNNSLVLLVGGHTDEKEPTSSCKWNPSVLFCFVLCPELWPLLNEMSSSAELNPFRTGVCRSRHLICVFHPPQCYQLCSNTRIAILLLT